MKIIQIISEHKYMPHEKLRDGSYVRYDAPKMGYKRVEAVVEIDGVVQTKHIDIPNE